MISFVIPALNEADNIQRTIQSIHDASNTAKLRYEIIVMDHGSQDKTKEHAERAGALVHVSPGGSIARLRNEGSTYAKGEILAFIDADVTLTKEWAENIKTTIAPIEKGAQIITGSHCTPPASKNLFLNHWFSALAEDPRNTHLGTGHMIISKAGFEEIGGFNESLKTGEDYEFCSRAKKLGFKIRNNNDLKVYHHDFPKTARRFIKREAWHGLGDLRNLSTAITSKVVWGSLIFSTCHLLLFVSLFMHSALIATISAAILIALLTLSSVVKNHHCTVSTIVINSIIFYFYYLGRTISFCKRLKEKREP
jgi:glycosyltransferase involved in cell wall biosynthesis